MIKFSIEIINIIYVKIVYQKKYLNCDLFCNFSAPTELLLNVQNNCCINSKLLRLNKIIIVEHLP